MRKQELLEKIAALEREVAELRGEVCELRGRTTPVYIPWYVQPNPEPYKITWGDSTGDRLPEPNRVYCNNADEQGAVSVLSVDGILTRWSGAWDALGMA